MHVISCRTYSLGELSTTAVALPRGLERLLSRLKIASKCVLRDRFPTVQGSMRQYRIHLGSGNILMEPNDQYLCIVPDAKVRWVASQVYLPSERRDAIAQAQSGSTQTASIAILSVPMIRSDAEARKHPRAGSCLGSSLERLLCLALSRISSAEASIPPSPSKSRSTACFPQPAP